MIRSNANLLEYISKPSFLEKWNTIASIKFDTAATIINQQSTSNAIYIVKKGITKCYLTEDTGVDFIQEFFGPGELFGEIEFFTQTSNFCAVVTIDQTEVFKIPHTSFTKLLATDRRFNTLIMEALAKKIRYKAIRHAYNQLHTIEDKVLRLKKEYPSIFETLKKKDIANYLGITMRSLNRSLLTIGTNNTRLNDTI
ncbi:Crp/Fnr family transcriptional regulator [Aquimarina sp. W85]|uniref:Crp/Fnr family transcriptional regulator n=1 Tax=Aquimarina rhodophyticola TaxID=3342246 RepID=UPI003670FEDA